MKTDFRLVIFALLVCAQLAVPGRMILQRENVLNRGQQYKIRLEPMDPSDPLMGRYVTLRMKNEASPGDSESLLLKTGQQAYLRMTQNAEGYMEPAEIYAKHPGAGCVIPVRISYLFADEKKIWFEYPFTRYYMNEEDAPEVDDALWSRRLSSNEPLNPYITIRIMGNAVTLEQLYMQGKPVEEFLRGR